jgi:hypothetical protein
MLDNLCRSVTMYLQRSDGQSDVRYQLGVAEDVTGGPSVEQDPVGVYMTS